MVGMRVENLRHGGKRGANLPLGSVSRAQAAKLVSVSPRSIADAAKVGAKGTKKLIRAVEDGKIAVSVAAKLADQDEARAGAAIKGSIDQVSRAQAAPRKRHKLVPYPKRSEAHLKQG
jgi:hypothetical protein